MKYLFALLLVISPLCSQAEVYKWVDEQGNTHYGDRPQAGDAEQLRIDKMPESGSESGDEISREEFRQRISDTLEEDRLARKEAREKKKQAREKKRRECNWLRDKQRRFNNAGGVYGLDKEGNRVFMSDEARKKTEQALRRQIQQTCE